MVSKHTHRHEGSPLRVKKKKKKNKEQKKRKEKKISVSIQMVLLCWRKQRGPDIIWVVSYKLLHLRRNKLWQCLGEGCHKLVFGDVAYTLPIYLPTQRSTTTAIHTRVH